MEAPTFEFGQILFINPTTHVLVVVLLLVLVMAVAMTVGGVTVIAVGIRLNTGIVGQQPTDQAVYRIYRHYYARTHLRSVVVVG